MLDYSDTKILRILNSELADTLGNLLSRCCGKALNPKQEVPVINMEAFDKLMKEDCTKKLINNLQHLPGVLIIILYCVGTFTA